MMPMIEMDTRYKERPVGSVSKLNTWRDGFRILSTIGYLVREERPLVFFSFFFLLLALASLIIGAPVVTEYLETGLVPRLPTAVLATGLMLLAFLSLTCGLILDTVTRGRWELKRMAYLAIPGPQDLTSDPVSLDRAYLLRHSFVRFAIIGACGYVVDAAVLALATDPLELDFATGNALSIFIAMAFTWLGNRYFTFRDQRARGLGRRLAGMAEIHGRQSLVGAWSIIGLSLALVHFAAFPLNNKFAAQAIGVLAGLMFNFTLSKTLVFRGSP